MISESRRPLVLVALLVAAFAISLDTTIVNVALPTLVLELDASTTQLEWIVDAYNLVFAALVLAAGSVSARRHAASVGRPTSRRTRTAATRAGLASVALGSRMPASTLAVASVATTAGGERRS